MKAWATTRPTFFDDPALAAVLAALPSARAVGGAVRDTLADRPIADIDLATPERPEAVIAALGAAGLKHAPTGLAHGTVTAISAGKPFEVTTLRRDESTDGRHATVAWTNSWEEDAARRDFTVNAMSMAPDGTLHDYFGGLADLRAGRVRFVGDPAARIGEDYLRILRFFRFFGRYGSVPPDPGTAEALRAGIPGMARLSPERVWSELKRILLIPDPLPALRAMHGLGVLAAALPGADPAGVARLVAEGAPSDAILRLAALGPAPGTAERLRLSNTERAALDTLAGSAPAPDAEDDALRQALADTPAPALAGRAWLAGSGPALAARIAALPRPAFPLAGRDAVRLGLPPGPAVGAALAATRAWWLAGGCRADLDSCRAELARHVLATRVGA